MRLDILGFMFATGALLSAVALSNSRHHEIFLVIVSLFTPCTILFTPCSHLVRTLFTSCQICIALFIFIIFFIFLAFNSALLSLSLTYVLSVTDLLSYFLRTSTDVEGLVSLHYYYRNYSLCRFTDGIS